MLLQRQAVLGMPPKKVCYSPKSNEDSTAAKDTSKDTSKAAVSGGFGGAGTKDASIHQWWIADDLVAPSKIGDYILQWRWDNEQTPQVWTTCADIRVDDSTSAGHASGAGGTGVILHILLWTAMAKGWQCH